MNLRFIERDGKKILQYEVGGGLVGEPVFVDVPYVEEKKEQRKMAEILKQANVGYVGDYYWSALSKAAIDAVIECYEDWDSKKGLFTTPTFPEYLKEKML